MRLSPLLLPVVLWMSEAIADPPRLTKPAATDEVMEKGRRVFVANCAPCHGDKGDGAGPVGVALNPRPRDFGKEAFKQGNSTEQIFKTISQGVPGTMMVAWPQLSEADRWAAAHFVTTMLPKPKSEEL
ncbi:MAG: cytochrome c [Myxococcota bacterium]